MVLRIFKMTEANMNSRHGKGTPNECRTCDVKIKVGDIVVTKSTAKRRTAIRHEDCAIKVGLITDVE